MIQPLKKVLWVKREELTPNNYNPNKVAPEELKLLKLSILENGWTQPIVVNDDYTIIDGFHRWTVSADKDLKGFADDLVPIVIVSNTNKADRQLATIRHNRARGTHGVLEMSKILNDLINVEKMTGEEIMKRLRMSKEEVTRLMFMNGIPKSEIFKNAEFSKAWVPK